MNPTTKIPKRVDEFRALLEPQRVLGPNECGLVNISDGQYSRSRPTALGGELPSHGGQPRVLGGMGRYYAESIIDGPSSMDLTTDWDEFTVRMGPKSKRWKIKAATARTTQQTLAWTRSLLEQLTQTEMEVSAAKFNISLRKLKIKGLK